MDFSRATRWRREADVWTADLPDTWMQGRTLFGGLTAAAALRALRALVAADRPPRAVQVTLSAPVTPRDTSLRAEVLRQGRSTTFARALLVSGGQSSAQLTAIFGAPRQSAIDARSAESAELPPIDAEGAVELRHIPGITPAFVQHFDLRLVEGGLPFTGRDERAHAGWCRHRGVAGDLPEALLALIDAWPSPALQQLRAPAPSSTVCWSVTFAELPASADPNDWWWLRSTIVTGANGYATMRGQLHARDGHLAATSEQLVALFD